MGNRLPSELGNNSVKIKINHPSEFQSKIASPTIDVPLWFKWLQAPCKNWKLSQHNLIKNWTIFERARFQDSVINIGASRIFHGNQLNSICWQHTWFRIVKNKRIQWVKHHNWHWCFMMRTAVWIQSNHSVYSLETIYLSRHLNKHV